MAYLAKCLHRDTGKEGFHFNNSLSICFGFEIIDQIILYDLVELRHKASQEATSIIKDLTIVNHWLQY